MTHSSGGMLLQKALAMSEGFPESRTIFDSTRCLLLLDTGTNPTLIRKEEIRRFLRGPNIPHEKHFFSRMLNPNHHVRAFGEIILPTGLLACMALIGNYSLTAAQRESSGLKPGSESAATVNEMTKIAQDRCKGLYGPCLERELQSPDLSGRIVSCEHQKTREKLYSPLFQNLLEPVIGYEIEFSAYVAQPSPQIFIFACMAYGIFAMLYYNLHTPHKYQQPILLLALQFGTMLSIYLRWQSTSLNVLTTIMPASMTFALIISALIHSIAGAVSHTEEEKVIRILDSWAADLVVSDIPP